MKQRIRRISADTRVIKMIAQPHRKKIEEAGCVGDCTSQVPSRVDHHTKSTYQLLLLYEEGTPYRKVQGTL